MAATIQSLGLGTSSEEKAWPRKHLLWKVDFRDSSQRGDKPNNKVGPTYPDFKHEIPKIALCIDGFSNPSWVGEEPRIRGLAPSTHAPAAREKNTEAIRDRAASFIALPQSQAAERHSKVAHNEGTAFLALLRVCTRNKDLYRGTRLHDDILKRGLLEKCSDALVTMYAKCGDLLQAKALLDMHKSRDVVPWTALIAGYARERQSQDALNCYEHMRREGISPNAVTYVSILKACGTIGAVDKGKLIHNEIASLGLLQENIVLGNALLDMYAKCGALAKAQRVLEKLPSRNVVSWSTLIAGYAQHGQGEQALNCFERMQSEGIPPNSVTYACILKACGTIGAVDKGKQIHDEIVRQGLLQDNIVLGSALVDMYAKCGVLAKAEHVLEELPSRDVVSWNALIAAYAQQGQGEEALNCFERMQHEGISPNVVSWSALIAGFAQHGQGEQALNCWERMQHAGILPNAVTYACILKVCGLVGATDKGQQIHDEIARQGLLQDNIVLGSALVDMYAKCGALTKAQGVLDELPSWDVVSWSALIAGYAQQGQGEEALNCFERMQREGIPPNAVTYASILKACGSIGAADKGKCIHDQIVTRGLLQDNIMLGSALVDMYAKCGALAKAQTVLEDLPSRDVVCWNALIAGYVQQGQGEQALNCFERMQHEGIPPDVVTFCCVLNVCSHLGLVEEGYTLFVNMSTKYGVKPDLEAYTCIIDLLGRAGHLEKAARLIREMPSSDHSAIWHALLGACQKWGDANVGKWAFDQAVQVDKRDGAAYVLMANIYAAAGMQENAENIEAMRMENKAWKKPGGIL